MMPTVRYAQGVKDTDALRKAVEEVQPENVKLSLRLSQSRCVRGICGAVGWCTWWESAHAYVIPQAVTEQVHAWYAWWRWDGALGGKGHMLRLSHSSCVWGACGWRWWGMGTPKVTTVMTV